MHWSEDHQNWHFTGTGAIKLLRYTIDGTKPSINFMMTVVLFIHFRLSLIPSLAVIRFIISKKLCAMYTPTVYIFYVVITTKSGEASTPEMIFDPSQTDYFGMSDIYLLIDACRHFRYL